ncbi:MAG: class I SAM-dependent methyltransferase [Myxococcaceae bacterium]|nr:class I SAM-dependent methyltransferase [Myxococcaceae bacterium]
MDQTHWESVYQRKPTTGVSWYRPHLDQSLRFIEDARLPAQGAIIDVGAGASTLVDDLLGRGYRDLTVLDLSPRALEVTRARLGDRGRQVKWVVGDVTSVGLPHQAYDFWHDRAVFHFLTDGEQRRRYVEQVRRCLRPGGRVLIATFSHEGPTSCSGLAVARYDEHELHAVFGPDFEPLSCATEQHLTPSGKAQAFLYCECRLRG